MHNTAAVGRERAAPRLAQQGDFGSGSGGEDPDRSGAGEYGGRLGRAVGGCSRCQCPGRSESDGGNRFAGQGLGATAATWTAARTFEQREESPSIFDKIEENMLKNLSQGN